MSTHITTDAQGHSATSQRATRAQPLKGEVPRPLAYVAEMAGYVPGEQPANLADIVKLNTNENPHPPSPRAMAAIRGIDGDAVRRYPDPSAAGFRATAAKLFDVSPDMIMATNGSDDVLSVVMRTYAGPGDVLAYPTPTYSLYPVLAQSHGVRVAEVPWNEAWQLPIERLLETNPNLIYIANPNAPSGTTVPNTALGDLCKAFQGPVLVDEAYVDFAETSALTLLSEHPNVIISRTLSKGYSLAGLRFGFAIAHPDITRELSKFGRATRLT